MNGARDLTYLHVRVGRRYHHKRFVYRWQCLKPCQHCSKVVEIVLAGAAGARAIDGLRRTPFISIICAEHRYHNVGLHCHCQLVFCSSPVGRVRPIRWLDLYIYIYTYMEPYRAEEHAKNQLLHWSNYQTIDALLAVHHISISISS